MKKKPMMKNPTLIRILSVMALLSLAAIACEFTITSNQFPEASNPTAIRPTSIMLDSEPPPTLQPATHTLQLPTQVSNPLITTNEEQILIELYKSINPSVVNINTYLRYSNTGSSIALGSGFIFDQDGNIVTNSHVIAEADRIEVVFADGLIQEAAVVGDDKHSDLAVIHVDEMPAEALPIPLGRMEQVAVGQTVVALGNPFGLGGTLTRGIISAMGRSIPAITSFSIPQAIQTDAPINPGNSGGPLLNLAGEVIGVNAQIETGSDSRTNSGVGFAIPISIVARVVPALIEDGSFQWSWLGVKGGNLTAAMSKAMKLPVDRGAYILEVAQGGPAERAGIKGSTPGITTNNQSLEVGGDVIIGINDTKVDSFEDLLLYIALNTEPGEEVRLTVVRDGQIQETTLLLQARPNNISDYVLP